MKVAADRTWRQRIQSIGSIGPLVRLIWHTSPWHTCACILLRVPSSVLPVTRLWIAKILIDRLLIVVSSRGAESLSRIWPPILAEFILMIVGDCLARATTLTDGLLSERVTNRLTLDLMGHAAVLDLAAFEDPLVS